MSGSALLRNSQSPQKFFPMRRFKMKKLLIAVCVMGSVLVGSALGKITYIDVTPDNATLNGAALIAETTYSTNYSSRTDNLWGWRTNRTDVNGNTVWETDGGAIVGDSESTLPLKIDITLPQAGVLYDLYAVIMNNNKGDGQWDVSARIGDLGDFKDFNKNSPEMTRALASDFEGTVVVSGADDRTFKVRIGYYVTAEPNEVVSISINGLDTWKNGASYDQRTRFDGVGYEVSSAVYEVSPYDGEIDVAAADVSLLWTGGIDPNVVGHYVYLGTGPDTLTCLNPAATVPVGTGAYTIGDIATDTTYYWQIEMVHENGQGGYPAGDPNNVFGPVWSFTTIISKPIVKADPSDQVVSAGGSAEFTVGVESLTTPTFKWYSSVDPVNNTPADDIYLTDTEMLSLTGVTLADERFYYCIVGNSSNTEVASGVAGLAIKRLVAHWSLNAADYVNGQYLDLSGEGHHADPNGTPTFVTGQVNNGISILCESGSVPTTESWASAGTWGISDLSGMLTVSFWINWSGPKSTYVTQNIICKGGESGTDWRVLTNGNGNLALSSSKATLTSSNAFLEIGTWVYCTIAFDGSVASFYKNGELVSSGSFRLGGADDGMLCLGGKYFDTNPEGWMNGSLDEVRIYNYDLSEMEVARLYIADKPNGSVCIASLKPDATYDINGDCIVNIADFAMLAAEWLNCGLMPDCVQ